MWKSPIYTTTLGWDTSYPDFSMNHELPLPDLVVEDINLLEVVKSKFYVEQAIGRWWDESWPIRKGDPGGPIIPIAIGPHRLEAICDLGAGVNVVPMVVYDKILQFTSLLNTNMHLRFADRSTRHVEGIIDDIYVLVGDSYVAADFMVLDVGHDQT